MMGSSISRYLAYEDQRTFVEATEQLLADDSRTVEVRFNVIAEDGSTTEMEGKGMLMYNRVTSEPSHTMWVIKPILPRRWSLIDKLQPSTSTHSKPEQRENEGKQSGEDEEGRLTIRNRSMSEPALESRGLSAESEEGEPALPPVSMDEQEGVQEADQEMISSRMLSPERLMSLPPVLCNVCERWVVAAFFEQHSELCVEIHASELNVMYCNDNLRDIRSHIIELLDSAKTELVRYEEEKADTTDNGESNQKSATEDSAHLQSMDDQDSIFGADALPVERGLTPAEQKKSEIEIYKDLIDILDVALSISMPGRSEDEDEDEMVDAENADQVTNKEKPRVLQSPRSKTKMVQILYWRPPTADTPEMTSLIHEVEEVTRRKVDAVNRMRDRLEYNERARLDFQKNMQREAGWTEFVPTHGDSSEKPQEKTENVLDQPKKKGNSGWLSKLKALKTKSVDKLARRNRRKQRMSGASGSTQKMTPPIVEAEVIDTPIGSPGLRPQTSKDSSTGVQQSTSTESTGKSPLSPLQAYIPPRATPPSIKDFDIIKPISKGAFGSVFLAKKRSTGDYYAIKFLKKSDMIAKNQVTNVKAERMILMTQTDSPFVTKLYYTFQSKDYLYLVLEYLNGGDCSALIKVLGSLPEDWARNYLAEVTLGLAYLHSRNVIHR